MKLTISQQILLQVFAGIGLLLVGTITIVGGDKNTVNIEDMPPAQVPAFLQWASQHP